MKRYVIFALLVMLMLTITGCKQSSDLVPLEEIPDTYSLEQAKEDGCVTHENGDVTQGKELFEAFFNNTTSGKKDTVRLAFYYTLDDPSRYDPDYYESVKDDYPVLYILDLSFDGENYTLRHFEDGEEIIKNYLYLMKYEGPAETPSASFKSYVRYVLTNDDAVTWQELIHGIFSSQFGDYIDHHSVCTDLIYD